MNATGLKTLFVKEVSRFLRVPVQTVVSPLISTTLYFVVFGYSLEVRSRLVDGVPYLSFIMPGLMFLSAANNAFVNTSSSMFIAKIQGTMVDLLVAPLGPWELLLGFVLGGVVRGFVVGLLTWLVAAFFVGFSVASPAVALFFLFASSYTFSALGMLTGLWAEQFEQVSLFPTFVMLPLTFLGGVFYSVSSLHEPWRTVSLLNPIVYTVEGLRRGMLGTPGLSVGASGVVLLAVALGLTWVLLRLLKSGWRLRT